MAKYCAKYLPEYLKNLEEYANGNLEEALKNVFLKFDESLLSPEAQKTLKELKDLVSQKNSVKANKSDNEEEEEEEDEEEEDAGEEVGEDDAKDEKEYASEADQLYDEATMPIEEVLKRYSNTQYRMKKALRKKKFAESQAEQSTSASSSGSKSAKKKPLAEDLDNNDSSSSSKAKPVDFQKQEELDINEIKKNSSGETVTSSNATNNHDQDYDEASNLCDITENSQKSSMNDTTLTTAVNTNSAGSSSVEAAASEKTEPSTNGDSSDHRKVKLNKDELKLSPIRKKSLSSSSLIDDPSESSISNCNSSNIAQQLQIIDEENKENDNTNPQEAQKEEAEEAGNKDENETKKDLIKNSTNDVIKKLDADKAKNPTGKGKVLSNTNLIAKLIAGCVNQKLKQQRKQVKQNNKSSKLKEQEDDDDDENESEDADDDGEAEDEEEDDDYKAEGDSDEDEEDDDEDEDDDYEDEDEEDDDDEEDDENFDLNGQPGMGMDGRPGYDSGCTAVVALLRDNKHLYVANAGDSRCVVCRDGKAVDMSVDHKPEDDSERERIEKAGGHVTKEGRVNNGLNLSRAIGDHSYKQTKNLSLSEQMITSLPDLRTLDIDPSIDKFMVLACDGIWNFMSSQEVCDYILERLDANYSKLSQICEELFMHCLAPDSEGDGTGCDNMTCIIVTFNPFKKVEINKSDIINGKLSLKRSLNESDKQNDSQLDSGSLQSDTSDNKKLKHDDETASTATTTTTL